MRTALAACAMLLVAIPSYSWEVDCETDDFTDEESCIIKHSESGFVLIGHTDDSSTLVLSVGNSRWDSYADDNGPFVARIDSNKAVDLEELGRLLGHREVLMAIFSDLPGAQALIQQLRVGKSVKFRVGTRRAYEDTEFSLSGFDKAWREFASSSPLSWVRSTLEGGR